MALITTICLMLILWVLYDIGMKVQEILSILRKDHPESATEKKPNPIAKHLGKRKGKAAASQEAAE